ncbi:switch-associated protein 70-like [Acanthaster planci]|uniref:Switch-associated protein 70-like n=1 Tax=Acanthaster planci TaxID=133434 RepID=A0A8B7XXM7_ACAPL|nr:switch-associated protein 70-like [Acanthaster planci]
MDKNEYVKRWLWHAFNGLDCDGTVDPQQLKVLTAHLGASLGSENKGNIAHKVGEKYRCESALAVCFSNYLDFLEEQGFLNNDKVDLDKLEETLWVLCLKDYQKRDPQMVANPELKKLWRLFNFLAEPDSFPVAIDREEMQLLTEKLVIAMGMKWDLAHFDHVTKNLKLFTFTKMMVCFESAFAKDMDQMCIAEAVMEVYDEIIEEVEKKGFLFKKGHLMKSWKERWFVLKPGCLSYYTGRNEKDKKGDIRMRASWKAEIIDDQKSYKNCFAIWTDDKSDKDKTRYELSASDPRTRQAWMIALRGIIHREQTKGLGQYGKLLERRERRRKERLEEEEQKRLEEETKRKREAELREERRRQEEAAERAAQELAVTKAKEEEERRRRREEKEAREKAEAEWKAANEAFLETKERLKAEEELRRAKEEEERLRRQQEEAERERISRERDEIKRALEDASKRADMEAGLKEAEQRRLAELEETLRHLQMLLDEEKRARFEQEQARELQQRLLDEEMQRREHLERLKEEQARLLAQEQQRREDLEVKSEELSKEFMMQEAILEEERTRLAELETQRQAADEKLQAAMEKIETAERNRKIIQKKREELSKTKTSLGLAQTIKPQARPLVTHRGLPSSAFAAVEPQDFEPHQEHNLQNESNAVNGQTDANGHL